MNDDPYLSNGFPAEPDIQRRKQIVIVLGLALLLPLCAVFFLVDSDRWLAQWQVWWGLSVADETARAPVENAQFYTKDDEWFVTYQFGGINELGVPERFEKTEEVSQSTVEKIEAKDGIMVDYVVGNPSIAGLETNHNPFSRFGLMLVLVGIIALRLLGRNSRRFRRAGSVVDRLSQKPSEAQNPDWMQQLSEPGKVEKAKKSRNALQLIVLVILVLALLVQAALLVLFFLGN